MKAGLGVDIGGTNTKIILISERARALKEIRFKTESQKGYGRFLGALSENINCLKKEFSRAKISGAGIGMAGDIDSDRGVLRFSPNLNGWRNIPLAADLGKKTGFRYVMENDANMAAWGAYVLELKKKAQNVLVATLGTGIGGGLILNGRLYHGSTGSAGEIGHALIVPDGEKCACGNSGCLEAYCGSGAIVKRAFSMIKDAAAYRNRFGAGPDLKINTVALANAADAGDKTAKKVWAETGSYLGRGFGSMILVLNPEYLILTGGVSKGARHFLPSMKKALREFRIRTPFEKVRVIVSENADLGSYGAALYGLHYGEHVPQK